MSYTELSKHEGKVKLQKIGTYLMSCGPQMLSSDFSSHSSKADTTDPRLLMEE